MKLWVFSHTEIGECCTLCRIAVSSHDDAGNGQHNRMSAKQWVRTYNSPFYLLFGIWMIVCVHGRKEDQVVLFVPFPGALQIHTHTHTHTKWHAITQALNCWTELEPPTGSYRGQERLRRHTTTHTHSYASIYVHTHAHTHPWPWEYSIRMAATSHWRLLLFPSKYFSFVKIRLYILQNCSYFCRTHAHAHTLAGAHTQGNWTNQVKHTNIHTHKRRHSYVNAYKHCCHLSSLG